MYHADLWKDTFSSICVCMLFLKLGYFRPHTLLTKAVWLCSQFHLWNFWQRQLTVCLTVSNDTFLHSCLSAFNKTNLEQLWSCLQLWEMCICQKIFLIASNYHLVNQAIDEQFAFFYFYLDHHKMYQCCFLQLVICLNVDITRPAP